MKKYLTFLIFMMVVAPCVSAQTVKRTAKTPNFFVPNGVLQNKVEKLPLRPDGYNRNTLSVASAESVKTKPLIHYKPAPVDAILEKQKFFSKMQLADYKKDIINAYKLSTADLQKILQSEYNDINKETMRMETVLRQLKTAPASYRLANFQIEKQISQDMVKNRKHYKELKQKFAEIIEKETVTSDIYIIEARNHLFWTHFEVPKILNKMQHSGYVRWKASQNFKNVTYISIFDSRYTHLFSYYRQHLNMLKNRRIQAPDRTSNFYIEQNITNTYQQLFDGYINDLNRIGKGLDINNPILLRQLNEMQDKPQSI